MPVEVWEHATSTTIERKAVLADSGGPGARRGGLGQEIVIRNDSGHPMTVFCMANRTEFPPLGLLGGKPGAKREHRINGAVVHPKGQHVLAPGDRITLVEAGGGGFGEPGMRPPELLCEDLARGFITRRGARRDYGYESKE